MSIRFATAKCVLLSLTAVMGLSLIAGCGSGGRTVGVGAASGGDSRAAKKGSITLNITWPARPTTSSKLIPAASTYIVVTATPINSTNATVVTGSATRPTGTGNQTSSVVLAGLQIGIQYSVTAVAYPDQTTGATAQAGATVTSPVIQAGTNPALQVTMGTTVTSVQINPTSVQLQLSRTTTVTATAYDATGAAVMTSYAGGSSIVFSSANPAIVSVTPNSNPATLTASATNVGTTTITAKYVENGVVVNDANNNPLQASISATVTTAGIGTGDWPKFHGNVGNTGMAPASVPPVALKGGYTFPYAANVSQQTNGSIVYSSPTFNKAGTIMYIGADDGYVYAFNINASGFVGSTFRWAFKTTGAIEGAPLVDVNDNVFVGSADGNLYAIKDVPGVGAAPASGQLIYKFAAGAAITGSPTIDKLGTIYFTTEPTYNSSGTVTTPGKLFFVDSLSGAAKTLNGSNLAFSGDAVGYNTTPALDANQDLVYVSSEAGVIYAVSTANASVRARYALSGDTISQSSPVVGTPANGSEMLYQGTTNGKLYEFRAAAINDGPVAGFTTYTATGSILSTPAFNPTNNVLVVATYDNSSGQNDSRVAVVDGASGTEIARTTPILTYLTNRDGVLTQADISQAQAFLFASSPAISSNGNVAYIGCEDGHVYSINIANLTTGTAAMGNSLSFTSLIETNGNSQVNPILIDSSPGIDLQGHVFIGGLDGSVYAITQ